MVREDPERRAVQSRSYYREQVGEDLAGRISGHRLTGYPAKKGKANTGSHETCCHDLFLVPTLDQRNQIKNGNLSHNHTTGQNATF